MKHVDDFWYDHRKVVRDWVQYHRSPADKKSEMLRAGLKPRLFATLDGERVELTMASRIGDVGWRRPGTKVVCYQERGRSLADFTDFSEEP